MSHKKSNNTSSRDILSHLHVGEGTTNNKHDMQKPLQTTRKATENGSGKTSYIITQAWKKLLPLGNPQI